MIPQTYAQWKHCIEKDCKIPLTKDFAQARLAVYSDAEHQETKKFINLYGNAHLNNVIDWLNFFLTTIDA